MKPEFRIPASVVLPMREAIGQSELLAELQISRMTLLNWRTRNEFPAPIRKVQQRKLYSTADISEWLRKHGSNVRLV